MYQIYDKIKSDLGSFNFELHFRIFGIFKLHRLSLSYKPGSVLSGLLHDSSLFPFVLTVLTVPFLPGCQQVALASY
jgi:hypothetical protein